MTHYDPNTPPAPVTPTAERIDTERSFWKFFFLRLITLGIYDIFFFQKLRNDVNVMCADDGNKTPGYWLALLLTIPTLGIYPMIWHCNLHDRMKFSAKRMGKSIEQTTSGIMLLFIGAYFFLGILNLVAFYKIIQSTNEMASIYNRHHGHYA